MKRKSIRLTVCLVALITLCLTLSSGRVRAEGEEYLLVPVEVRDIGGKLPEDASFLITVAPKDGEDTVSPLPTQTQTTLHVGETDTFAFERAAFTEPDDYLYTVTQEKATGDDNVITEETSYTVTVRVVKEDGGLQATVDILKDGQNRKSESVVFSNNDKRALKPQDNHGDADGNPSSPTPNTGEAFPYLPVGLLGGSALLGAWIIARQRKTVSAQREGTER